MFNLNRYTDLTRLRIPGFIELLSLHQHIKYIYLNINHNIISCN